VIGDHCIIRLLSDDGKLLTPVAIYHPNPELHTLLRKLLEGVPHSSEHGLDGLLFQSGRAMLIPDVDPEELRGVIAPSYRPYVERHGIESVLLTPLRVRGRVVGTLFVARDKGGKPYSSEDQVFLQELADRAALAIDNTGLYQKLSERERQLQDLVGRLLVAQDEERRRVAYEVHDELAQVVASAHQHLQAFARYHRPQAPEAQAQLDRALGLAQRTIRETRRVVANLRSTTLDDFRLAAAIRLQVEDLRVADHL
jgi:signal transduction histidine kinase